ncbi:MAG: nuclear transport factor 2 family protein [Pseudomonadota bacterium]
MTPRETVLRFWQMMSTNDWEAAAAFLAEEYVCDWPQSGERIVGRANFIAIQANYPANGPWRFTIRHVSGGAHHASTDVHVTDGTIEATALTFSTVENGLITRQTEYWPDPMPRPAWRAQWITDIPTPDAP